MCLYVVKKPEPGRNYSNIDPAETSIDKVLPNRRRLDRVVFEVLGLTDDGQLKVYRAVVGFMKNRLVGKMIPEKWYRKPVKIVGYRQGILGLDKRQKMSIIYSGGYYGKG